MKANPKKWLPIAIPYLWLLIFFLAPFLIVLKISLSDAIPARPPYTPTIEWNQGWEGITQFFGGLDLESFQWLLGDALYVKAFLSSFVIAGSSTILALIIGFPLAYAMAKAPKKTRNILVMLVILPFWTSFLIRVYAWIGILKTEGLLNQFLIAAGIINEPLILLNTNIAVYIGIVYSYLPFMVLPIYATLERMDESLIEAAIDLGRTKASAFRSVTLPLAIPGILAGCFLVFIPAMGEFVIPDLLGGSDTLMIGKVLWTEFFSNRDWPIASAVAITLLTFLVAPIVLMQRQIEKRREQNQ